MSPAEIAMFALLPLMFGGARLRVWLALMAGHAASWVVPHVPAFILFDLLTAAIVLSRPAGEQQKLIGLLSVGMAITGIGYLTATEIMGYVGQPRSYGNVLRFLGWLQILVLGVWGVGNGLDWLRHHSGLGLPYAARKRGVRQ